MSKLNILHICPDFPYTKLYNLLITHLMKYQQNEVYVSTEEKHIPTEYPIYWGGRKYNVFDRIVFFRKQQIIKNDIKKLGLCNSCQIIHAHTLFSAGYTARKLSREYNIPYIVAVRNTDVNTFFRYMIHLRSLGVRIMNDAAAVVFLSPAYKKLVLDQYVPARHRESIRKKSLVIPNGIDRYFIEQRPQTAKQLLSEKTVRLIYVGEINKNKNITTTIKACELLEQRGIKPTLQVVGTITDKHLEGLKNNRFVEYYPQCTKEEVLQHLRNNDIFVMPSLTETFGLVYIEALSQGLPIIYSEGQGIDGYFDEGCVGYHVRSSSAEEIALKIEKTMKDYTAMSNRCMNMAQSFTWAKIAETYNRLYLESIPN